jgi:hypothetical protein
MVRESWRPDYLSTGPSANVRRLVQKAISSLRQNLAASWAKVVPEPRESQVSDEAIMAALFLAHIAMGSGDDHAFAMHRQGLGDMIESRGGLNSLGLNGMIKCSVLQYVPRALPSLRFFLY